MELHQRLNLDHLTADASEPNGTGGGESTVAALIALVNAHFDTEPSPETPLAEVNITSLDRIELAIRIEEQFGVPVNEAVYEDSETVADLADYLDQHSPDRKAQEEQESQEG